MSHRAKKGLDADLVDIAANYLEIDRLRNVVGSPLGGSVSPRPAVPEVHADSALFGNTAETFFGSLNVSPISATQTVSTDFDMLRRRVNVSRSVTESGGLAWSTPKTWERRSVPFPASLAEELSAAMVGKGRDALVFTDQRGGVLRNSNWRARVFGPAVAKCQKADETFPSITPHDLRHTAASLAVSAGANVKAVQRMLGHAKASMTLDV